VVIASGSDAGPVTSTETDAVTAERVAHQLSLLSAWFPDPPARILDVGCGTGELAAALGRQGYEVTAIDIDAGAIEAAQRIGVRAACADIAVFDAPLFDVVIFSLSLHHVDALDSAVAQSSRLLDPSGVLIVDEFAWDRADRTTAEWFYDTAAVLDAAGVLRTAGERPPRPDPLAHWVDHHSEHHMHPGLAMLDAIGGVFDIQEQHRVPYLYRYLGGWLASEAVGASLFATLRQIETMRIQDGRLQPTGLRLRARAASGRGGRRRAGSP